MRILKSHPLLKMVNSYIIDSPQPSNLSYLWNFSSLLAFCLIMKIIAGVTLGMHYTPNVLEAFNSVEHIIYCDAPEPWGLFFQDNVSPVEGLEELHNSIMFYLAAIFFAVSWIIVSIILNYMAKYVVRGSLEELILIITPPFSLILITLMTLKLLIMDVTDSSGVIFNISCILFAVICIMVPIIWGYPLKDYIYIFEELLRWSIFLFFLLFWLSTTWVIKEYPQEFLSFEDIISGGDPIQVVLSEPYKYSSTEVQGPRLLDWTEKIYSELDDLEETDLMELYWQMRDNALWGLDTAVLFLVLNGYMTVPVANSLIDYVMERV